MKTDFSLRLCLGLVLQFEPGLLRSSACNNDDLMVLQMI